MQVNQKILEDYIEAHAENELRNAEKHAAFVDGLNKREQLLASREAALKAEERTLAQERGTLECSKAVFTNKVAEFEAKFRSEQASLVRERQLIKITIEAQTRTKVAELQILEKELKSREIRLQELMVSNHQQKQTLEGYAQEIKDREKAVLLVEQKIMEVFKDISWRQQKD